MSANKNLELVFTFLDQPFIFYFYITAWVWNP